MTKHKFAIMIHDLDTWFHENKLRLLVTLIIAFIISIILPIWSYTTQGTNLSDCVGLALIFTCTLWGLFYHISKNFNSLVEDMFTLIGGLIKGILCVVLGLCVLFIAIKLIKFMWIM